MRWSMVMGVERPAGAKPHVLWGRWRCSKHSPSRKSGDLLDVVPNRENLLPAAPVGAGGRGAIGLLIFFVSENGKHEARRKLDGRRTDRHILSDFIYFWHIAAPASPRWRTPSSPWTWRPTRWMQLLMVVQIATNYTPSMRQQFRRNPRILWRERTQKSTRWKKAREHPQAAAAPNQ